MTCHLTKLVYVTLLRFSNAAVPRPVRTVSVDTTSGVVVGLSMDDGSAEFKGIPYAEPPLGVLRFAKPEPMRWRGLWNATQFRDACMQPPSENFPPGMPVSEDCLYLNVWTPPNWPLPAAPLRPVPIMFFIHGGGFITGAASEPLLNGRRLAKKGVLLVSPNYRLGAFGLLATRELQEQSNATGGLNSIRDQVLALKWTKDNAAVFGGNPEEIMVFGQSAGSISSCIILAIEQARSLFARVGLESGACNGDGWGPKTMLEGFANSKLLMIELGVSNVSELRSLNGTHIVSARTYHYQGPSLDGELLTEMPVAVFSKTGGGNKQLLVGSTSVDGLFEPPWVKKLLFQDVEEWRSWLQAWFGGSAKHIEKLYPASTPRAAMQAASKIAGDVCVRCPTKALAEEVAPTTEVYAYEFAFMPNMTYPSLAPHSAELFLVFGNRAALIPPYGWSTPLSDLMMTEWSNFAKGIFFPKREAWPAFISRNQSEDSFYVFDWPSAAVPGAAPGLRHGWQTKQCDLWDALKYSSKVNRSLLIAFCLDPTLLKTQMTGNLII